MTRSKTLFFNNSHSWMASFVLAAVLLCVRWGLDQELDCEIEPVAIMLPVTEVATWRQLDGAGERLLRVLEQYQRMVSPVRCLDDLRHVPGIGPRRLHQWMPWLRPLD